MGKFKTFRKMPISDVLVMVIVTLITAITKNLAVAVLTGIIISALVFSWENAKRIRARKSVDKMVLSTMRFMDPFFGSIKAFSEKFNPSEDPDEVVIDFKESRIVDMSAIEAVNAITRRYRNYEKTIYLRHLSDDCKILLQNADAIIEVNVIEDPSYKVLTNKLNYL